MLSPQLLYRCFLSVFLACGASNSQISLLPQYNEENRLYHPFPYVSSVPLSYIYHPLFLSGSASEQRKSQNHHTATLLQGKNVTVLHKIYRKTFKMTTSVIDGKCIHLYQEDRLLTPTR